MDFASLMLLLLLALVSLLVVPNLNNCRGEEKVSAELNGTELVVFSLLLLLLLLFLLLRVSEWGWVGYNPRVL